MTLSGTFAAAAGSVTGRDHRRAERDGQDGCAVVATESVVAAIVTDGCSSGRASEIGARLGAAWIAALVAQCFAGAGAGEGRLREARGATDAAVEVCQRLLARLQVLARSLDPEGDIVPARVEDALLFGFLAAVVTPETTVVFGIGDGIVAIDGAVTVIDPGPRNAPPYVAYGLFGTGLEPQLHFVGPTRDVALLAVATDGLAPMTAPDDRESSLLTLVDDPRYARNPSLLRKRLVVLSDRGMFSDDATLGVVRRIGR